MLAVWQLIDKLIGLYMFIVVVSVVLTWLVQFKVVNTSNQLIYMLGDFLYRVTEPLLKRIRSVIPPIGGTFLPCLPDFFRFHLQNTKLDIGNFLNFPPFEMMSLGS